MKYGVIFFENQEPTYADIVTKFKEFDSLDQLKTWIRANHGNKRIRVIEFQDIEYTTELKVEIKRPGTTRSSFNGEGNMKV